MKSCCKATKLSVWLMFGLMAAACWRGAADEGPPKRGGVFRIAKPSDPQSLDPAIIYDSESVLLDRLVFEGLIDYDDGVNLVPKQAESWGLSDDHKTYTFHLRPGIRFANGRPVEASDYVYTFQRLVDLKTQSPGETFFRGIAGVKDFQEGKSKSVRGLRAPDAGTFVVELDQPDYTFQFVVAMTFACVVPREEVEKYGEQFSTHASGSGPYRVKEWKRGSRIIFERNPYFESATEGFLDQVDVMVGGDRTLHAMMFDRGERDFLYKMTSADLIRMIRSSQKPSLLHLIPMAETDYMVLNTEMPPFDNLKVRQAIAHAIDRDKIAAMGVGFTTKALGILPPSMPAYNPALRTLEYNPEKAKALLREAGFPNGFSFDLIFSPEDSMWERAAGSIERDLARIGVTANLLKRDLATLVTVTQTRKQSTSSIQGWSQDYPDPSNFLDVLYNGTRIQDAGCNNLAFYNNPTVNTLLRQAGELFDLKERAMLYGKAEQLVTDEAPLIALDYQSLPVAIQPWVKGFKPHPVWQIRYETLWIDK